MNFLFNRQLDTLCILECTLFYGELQNLQM